MFGFLRSRTFEPQVLTRPNEKSSCPSTCDEFSVMYPFESIAGWNTCRSIGAETSCWAAARRASSRPATTPTSAAILDSLDPDRKRHSMHVLRDMEPQVWDKPGPRAKSRRSAALYISGAIAVNESAP